MPERCSRTNLRDHTSHTAKNQQQNDDDYSVVLSMQQHDFRTRLEEPKLLVGEGSGLARDFDPSICSGELAGVRRA